jgi:DHA3 family macrolide efflux protein-like MFS transporter
MNRVALARFISRSGGEAAFFVGIWGKASYEFNATPSALALVMAALGIASLVGSIWSGLLLDRLGNRKGRQCWNLS